jgi:ElaA protein
MSNHSKLTWKVYEFPDLSRELLYQILRVRQEVFILEQNCFYLDADGKDTQAIHICGFLDNKLAGYARILPPGYKFEEVAFGRVLITKDERGKGEGKVLTQKILDVVEDYFGGGAIRISAQSYLQRFYEGFGFKAVGEEYLDAGVQHIEMLRE